MTEHTRNWTFEELEQIQDLMERSRYNQTQLEKINNLYNRVFNKNKPVSSCGKCNRNKLDALRRVYEAEKRYWAKQ